MDWRVGITTFKSCLLFWLDYRRLAEPAGYCYIRGVVESAYGVNPEAEEDSPPTPEPAVSIRVWVPMEWKRALDEKSKTRSVGLSTLLRLIIYDYLFPKSEAQ